MLFFERDIFYEYKILKQTEGYEIVSISKYLFDVNIQIYLAILMVHHKL